MVIVVDTSIVIALLLPESGSAAVRQALEGAQQVISTDLLSIELLNAAGNMARRNRLPWPELEAMLDHAAQLPVILVDHRPLLPLARRICRSSACAAYDAVLVALAAETASPLLTLDARLARTLEPTVWKPWVRCIQPTMPG